MGGGGGGKSVASLSGKENNNSLSTDRFVVNLGRRTDNDLKSVF